MLTTKSKALISGFIFSVLFLFLNFGSKCESISNKVFRLHIIANSDSASDQALKLKVRDRILRDAGPEFSNAKDLLDAKKITEKNLELIKNLAQDEILKNGYNYVVKASVVKMPFDTRVYDHITLPAGYYDALRITIGNAKGKNWWCVMFPPMCLPAAQDNIDVDRVLNPYEYRIVHEGNEYTLGFKSVELFFKVKEFLKNNICDPINDLFSSEIFKYKIGFKIFETFDYY